MFLDHTQRRTTVGRTPLAERSARRRDLYLTTRDTHNRQISIPPVGFEPTISAGERPQTYALDRAATGTGCFSFYPFNFVYFFPLHGLVFLYYFPLLFHFFSIKKKNFGFSDRRIFCLCFVFFHFKF